MSRLAQISERLEEITRRLGEQGDAADDEQVVQLTAEAADLAAEAVEEVNKRLRPSPGDG